MVEKMAVLVRNDGPAVRAVLVRVTINKESITSLDVVRVRARCARERVLERPDLWTASDSPDLVAGMDVLLQEQRAVAALGHPTQSGTTRA